MRSQKALSFVLAFVAPLLLVDVAQAYYTPGLGRFIGRDPIFERGGVELYGYVNNQPTLLVDPLGLKPANQCQMNGQPVAFGFDGENFSGNGLGWEAVSGKPISVTTKQVYKDVGGFYEVYERRTLVFDYTKERQKKKGEGPIPEGGYWFDICGQKDATNTWRHKYRFAGYGAWGDYGWELHADAGTETYGRGGFFIHGGDEWGSAGCIDLKHNDSALAEFLKDVKKQNCGCCCYINIKVAYDKDKVTKTETLFSHFYSPRELP